MIGGGPLSPRAGARRDESPQRRAAEQILFHGHPSWRSILGFYVKGFLTAVVLGAIAGVLSDVADGSVQSGWVTAVVILVLALVVLTGFLRRVATTYTITDQRLTIARGLLGRDVHETRLERVQNVNCSQSLLQRLLGVGTVDFDTAGSAEFDFAFHGVGRPRQLARTVDRALQHAARAGPWSV
jgi:uncharacterized membrane protein YdbT with pleckstrin-like domain